MAGGRSASKFVTKHFTFVRRMDNRSQRNIYHCNYCGDGGPQIENRDNRLAKHLIDPQSCPTATPQSRNEARQFMASQAPVAELQVSSTGNSDNTTTPPSAVGQAVPRKKRVTTLDGYVDHPLTEAQQQQANVKLLRYVISALRARVKLIAHLFTCCRFLVHANIALRASENPYFREFVDVIRPSYMPPSRYILSHRLLDAELARVELEDVKRLEQRTRLTLLIDGWTDMIGRDLYGLVGAEVNQYPVVLGLKDMTGVRATAENIFREAAVETLKRYGLEDSKNLIALTTDDPTVMRKFRSLFEKEYHWILVCILTKYDGKHNSPPPSAWHAFSTDSIILLELSRHSLS